MQRQEARPGGTKCTPPILAIRHIFACRRRDGSLPYRTYASSCKLRQSRRKRSPPHTDLTSEIVSADRARGRWSSANAPATIAKQLSPTSNKRGSGLGGIDALGTSKTGMAVLCDAGMSICADGRRALAMAAGTASVGARRIPGRKFGNENRERGRRPCGRQTPSRRLQANRQSAPSPGLVHHETAACSRDCDPRDRCACASAAPAGGAGDGASTGGSKAISLR